MSKECSVRVTGPLEAYASGFRVELVRQGWSPGSAAHQLRLVAHLSRWLDGQGLDVTALSSRRLVERFAATRRAAGYSMYCSVRALEPLLRHLRAGGVVEEETPEASAPDEVLLARYRSYLLDRRGLAADSADVYIAAVRGFVADRVNEDGVDLQGLSAAEVTAFLLSSCTPDRPGKAKTTATALRSLLGFLHVEGFLSRSLAGAVPRVASWSLSSLPRGLEAGEVRRLLAACDRRTGLGRRDYAMLLLLARLGLRCGEVAGLQLDDVDWHAGELLVRGKGGRDERLPLPVDVGEALVAYLRRGRPATAQGRAVFVRHKAPHHGVSSAAVSERVCAAGRRSGVGDVRAHRLRHTAGTDLLAAGAPLLEVGQLLRHRKIATTAIYAKVDRSALAVLARPWPARTS